MLKFIQNFLDIKEKGMIVEIVKFNATDGIHLDGILYKCDLKSKKVLIFPLLIPAIARDGVSVVRNGIATETAI